MSPRLPPTATPQVSAPPPVTAPTEARPLGSVTLRAFVLGPKRRVQDPPSARCRSSAAGSRVPPRAGPGSGRGLPPHLEELGPAPPVPVSPLLPHPLQVQGRRLRGFLYRFLVPAGWRCGPSLGL